MARITRNRSLVFVLFTCFFIFNSCKRDINANSFYNEERECKIKSVRYDSIVFKIDDLSLHYSTTIQYVEDSVKKYFTYYNTNNSSIYFFDYKTKQQEFIWNIADSDFVFDSYYIFNMDSIFLFNTRKKCLKLFNFNGELKNKFNFAQDEMIDETDILPYPYLTSTLPLICYKSNIYITGYHVGEFADLHLQRKAIHKYGTKTKKSSFLINFPDLYNNYNWGVTYLYITSSTCNYNTHSLILNFPIYHYLVVYNLLTGKEKLVCAASKNIKSIEPLKDKKEFVNSNLRLKYYLQTPSYTSVFYDKYKNIYYRIAAMPLHKFKRINIREIWGKRKFSIIVLDGSFEYVGEFTVNNILPENVFITEHGIHIQSFSNDDFMKFKIFNIEL